MADKKSAAARKKHAHARGEAKRGKREKKEPESKKLARAGKAEEPAAKVKRGEKEKAPKQAKKAAKGGEEESNAEDLPEGEEPDLEAVVADVGDLSQPPGRGLVEVPQAAEAPAAEEARFDISERPLDLPLTRNRQMHPI